MLSVIIPAYNERDNIAHTAETLAAVLRNAEIPYELLFVDDGSTDGSWDAVRRCSAEQRAVRGLSFSRNFGKESAIFAGLAAAKGDCCVVIDCDYVSDASLEAVNLGQKDWVGTAAAFDHCATDNATAINDTCFGGLAASAFKDYAQGNYTPKSGGPLTDKGVTPEGWADLVDLAGKPRVIGKTIDIGCYEGNCAGLILNIK